MMRMGTKFISQKELTASFHSCTAEDRHLPDTNQQLRLEEGKDSTESLVPMFVQHQMNINLDSTGNGPGAITPEHMH